MRWLLFLALALSGCKTRDMPDEPEVAIKETSGSCEAQLRAQAMNFAKKSAESTKKWAQAVKSCRDELKACKSFKEEECPE